MRIENHLSRRPFLFDVEKEVNKLLSFIPPEHLMGLERIVLLDEIWANKGHRLAGTYKMKQGLQGPAIEISINSTFRGMPHIFFCLPFVARFTLADILYHEIGHHYHSAHTHGVNKKRKEQFAEDYGKIMLRRAVFFWTFFLRPLSPVLRYLA